MLARIPVRLFHEWQAYAAVVGPFNEERKDWRFANVCAVVATIMGAKDVTASTFMPNFGDKSEAAEAEQKARKLAKMHAWKYQHSAEARRKREGGKR